MWRRKGRIAEVLNTLKARKLKSLEISSSCERSRGAMSIHLAIMKLHMIEPDIGKGTQATIVKQLAFFKKTGSCPNGRSHRTNLLGFKVHLLLTGKNWVQEKVENVSSF
uniref:Uncharacterized protein n=1 Tax=Glossina palpalis gambiensis TaxID=67801 RepID=A0A1B0AN36_9MUSC